LLERPPEAPRGSFDTAAGPEPAVVALPEVLPGRGSAVASTAGPVELVVPVSLSSATDLAVTVRWRTLHVDDVELEQAPRSDYVAASGCVTFAPGQTEASISVTVLGNSTGRDEAVLVSFTDPTNAVVGGAAWGLGAGTIAPAP
jgi:hypothetical protein